MPPRKKYAIKGEQHFHNLSDDKLRDYSTVLQGLLLSYPKRDYPQEYSALLKCRTDVVNELVDREHFELEECPIAKVTVNIKRKLKSPAKSKI